MKKVLCFAVVALSLCFCTCVDRDSDPVTPPANRGAIRGDVTDGGEPVWGADVELLRNGSVVGSEVTNSDGSYRFTNLNAGSYTRIIKGRGYEDHPRDINILRGDTLISNVSLTRQPARLRLVPAGRPVDDIDTLNINSVGDVRSFDIFNDNLYALEWWIESNVEWITFNPLSGTLSHSNLADRQQPVGITINGSKLTVGDNSAVISIMSNFGSRELTINMNNVVALTITLNANEGVLTSNTVTVNSGTSIGELTLPTPMREGYAFAGWYSAAYGGTRYADDNIISSDMTLFAQWTLIHMIMLDANGGVTLQTSVQVLSGSTLELSSLPTPTFTGYVFNGWFNAPTSGVKYGDDITVMGDLTFYAQWLMERRVDTAFTNVGKHFYPLPTNITFPATIEVYALGAGGGGQGGATNENFWTSNTNRTGGSGGGGAVAYMRFNVTGETTLEIHVGKGGDGGYPRSCDGCRGGHPGLYGEESRVDWGSNHIIARGGGGASYPWDWEERRGGTAGTAIIHNAGGVLASDSNQGEPGQRLDGGTGCQSHSGGNPGRIEIGSVNPFTGGLGAFIGCIYGESHRDRAVGLGGGGTGGWDGGARGWDGGNGQVRIIITYFEQL